MKTSCPRCFHIIGEHLLCLEHGGEYAFTGGKPKIPDLPPPEAIYDFQHSWWSFLDLGEKVTEEAIP